MLLVLDAAAQIGLRRAALPTRRRRRRESDRPSASVRPAGARPRPRARRTALPPTARRPRRGSCRRRSATPARPRPPWRSRRPCARPSDTSRPCDRRGPGTRTPSAISPSPTAVVKLSTRNSSIGTRRVPALPRTTTAAREASATAVQSPAGSLWHRLPTTVPICRTTGSATTRDTSWMRLQRRSPIHGARSMSLSRAIAPIASTCR